MIQVKGLTKSFNGRPVLRGVDLHIPEGECLAIMGPNGAGKTTLLRILATLSRPSGGWIRIAGLAPAHQADAIRQRIGFLSHQPLLYGDLSAEENLRFYGRMYGVPNLEERISAILDHVGLASRRFDLVRTFSRGMKQRLAIARVLVHEPKILLMDEPFTGLDEQAANMLDTLVGEYTDSGRTIVLTTHNPEHGLRLSHRAATLVGGQITCLMDRSDWNPERFRQGYHEQIAPTGG
jgi:heme exporter protein A